MNEQTPLKILHLASGDLWAGAEMQLFTLVRSLSRRGDLSIGVILLNHGELEQRLLDAGIEVLVLDESSLRTDRLLAALVRHIRRINPDVIHTHRFKENVLGSLAGLFCGRVKSIRTTHGASEFKVPWWRLPASLFHFLDWLAGRYYQDRIIAVSEDLADKLATQFPRNKIEVVVNGIDLSAFVGIDTSCPFPPGNEAVFHVGLVGRLVPVKRVDLFIDIAECVAQMDPGREYRFHVIGDGPLHSELEALSSNSLAANTISFEGHQKNIFSWIKHIDLLVMCSDHEGLPMTLLEAMALGTPIVAHAVGGINTLLDNGNCGVLIPDQSAHAYAKEILRLADNSAGRDELREQAATRVATAYSAERNADAVKTIYTHLCGHKSAS